MSHSLRKERRKCDSKTTGDNKVYRTCKAILRSLEKKCQGQGCEYILQARRLASNLSIIQNPAVARIQLSPGRHRTSQNCSKEASRNPWTEKGPYCGRRIAIWPFLRKSGRREVIDRAVDGIDPAVATHRSNAVVVRRLRLEPVHAHPENLSEIGKVRVGQIDRPARQSVSSGHQKSRVHQCQSSYCDCSLKDCQRDIDRLFAHPQIALKRNNALSGHYPPLLHLHYKQCFN